MKRAALLGFAGAVWLAHGAFAQNPGASQSAPTATAPKAPSAAAPQTRPDAKYANPSGQDSQPGKTAPKAASGSAPGTGTVDSRGAKTANQSAASQGVAKQKAYTGNSGKKGDAGTACSTARPTPNGGLDCGTSGEGATPGKNPR